MRYRLSNTKIQAILNLIMLDEKPPKNKTNLSRSLRIRFAIFWAIIFLSLIGLTYDALRYNTRLYYILTGLVAGIMVGLVFSRMYKITWSEEDQQVAKSIDAVGVVILVLYLIFTLKRSAITQHFTQGPSVATISLAVLLGVTIGRLLESRHKIAKIIKDISSEK